MILDEMQILAKTLTRFKGRKNAEDLTMDGAQPCDLVIEPAILSGSISAIPSKSYAQRAYIAAALADKETKIERGAYLSDDMLVTLSALESMGAQAKLTPHFDVITPLADTQHIEQLEESCSSSQHSSSKVATSAVPLVNCGESGTVARLLLPILTALFEEGILTGEGSLPKRPFETLCKTIEQGGQASFDQYRLPISWRGRLQSGSYSLPGDESSQYLSGLLFALPLVQGDSTINLSSELQSAGYVDMTLDVLRQFGICVEYDGSSTYHIPGGQHYHSPGSITVEGDWSNSAFWLAAGVEVTGLNPESLQRDRFFPKVKGQAVIDATDIPDLVPILSICAALTRGTTGIQGIKRLRIKESDRISTTLAMLKALGCKAKLCTAGEEKLLIQGTGTIPGGGVVDGAHDHRIVMAAAIAASFAQEPLTIRGAQAVAKTYAHFFEDFRQLGGKVHVV